MGCPWSTSYHIQTFVVGGACGGTDDKSICAFLFFFQILFRFCGNRSHTVSNSNPIHALHPFLYIGLHVPTSSTTNELLGQSAVHKPVHAFWRIQKMQMPRTGTRTSANSSLPPTPSLNTVHTCTCTTPCVLLYETVSRPRIYQQEELQVNKHRSCTSVYAHMQLFVLEKEIRHCTYNIPVLSFTHKSKYMYASKCARTND